MRRSRAKNGVSANERDVDRLQKFFQNNQLVESHNDPSIEPEYAMVTGRVTNVSKSVNGSFRIFAVKSGKQYNCSCPNTKFFPLKEGDVIEGIAQVRSETELLFPRPPVVQISLDRDSIVRCMIRVLKGTGFGSQKALKFFNYLKIRSGAEANVAGYITELAEKWRSTHDSTLLLLFEEYIEGTTLTKWLNWWYKNQALRRLYLLGLNKKEIKAIDQPLEKIYEICLTKPYLLLPLSLEKAEDIMARRNIIPTEISRLGAIIMRKIYEICENKSWVGIPSKMLTDLFPSVSKIIDYLKDEYKLRAELFTIYLAKAYSIEIGVLEVIEKKLKEQGRSFTSEMANFLCPTLTSDQKEAVVAAISHPLTIIQGGAGVGKTLIIREIIHNLDLLDISYLVVSFTGKAVARLREVLNKKTPMTMHRAIRLSKSGIIQPFDFLIIDETSMVTSDLFLSFINRFPGNYSITMVGDPNQLEPIGAGALFEQLIRSKRIPIYTLKKIHRTNADGIIQNCNRILEYSNGGLDSDGDPLPPFEFEGTSNFFLQPGNIETVFELVSQLKQAGVTSDRVTVISPYNREVEIINPVLSKMFNSENQFRADSRSATWRIGDRVSLTVNRYDINVMNGEEGKIVDLDKDSVRVQFKDGATHSFKLEPTPGFESLNPDDDEEDYGEKGELTVKSLRHSFALTVHLCVSEETYIFTESGLVEIRDLHRGNKPLFDTNLRVFGKNGITRCLQVYWGFKERSIKITSQLGYQLEGSYRHPILTEGEVWKTLPEIRIGDRVILKNSISNGIRIEKEGIIIDEEICYFLGRLVGEGDYWEKEIVRGTTTVKNFNRIRKIFWETIGFVGSVRIEQDQLRFEVNSPKFRKFLGWCGLDHLRSEDKRIPWVIRENLYPGRQSFIRGLSDSNGLPGEIYRTTNERLSIEIQLLLLNLGIVSSRIEEYSVWIVRELTEEPGNLIDSIVKIENGNCQMYDLYIEDESHSFISNGFVSHNCQGSEFEFTIFYLPETATASSFLSRRLIYTALSRAKRGIWCVGNINELHQSALRPPAYRCDNLCQRLIGNNIKIEIPIGPVAQVVEEIFDEK